MQGDFWKVITKGMCKIHYRDGSNFGRCKILTQLSFFVLFVCYIVRFFFKILAKDECEDCLLCTATRPATGVIPFYISVLLKNTVAVASIK